MLHAITRGVSPSIGRCELTHFPRVPIDYSIAKEQHHQYEDCLASLGCEIHRIPAAPDLPDCVFVEDICIVLDELAIITRPGAESRRPETAAVAQTVRQYRELIYMEDPGTIDGGDVLCMGKRVFVGRSSRTNAAGIDQLRNIVAPFGYEVMVVLITDCLHLQSAVTQISPKSILVNRQWVDPRHFGLLTIIDVDPIEPFGANALLIGDTVVYPANCPATQKRLEQHGVHVKPVDISELAKAEGAVTCCSLIFSVS